jgi:type I restriction enzyme S subunit
MLFFKQWPVSYNTPYEKIGDEVRSLAGEVPFEIPDSWEWARLGSVVYNRGQTSPSTEFCYIDIGSIDNKNQKLNPTDTTIAPDKAPSRARKLVDMGDILYSTVRPYLHNMCIIDREFPHIPIASTGFAVLTCHANLLNKYLFYYLMSPDFDAYANNTDNAKGVAYPAINDDRLYKALIPIPPVAEQHRIVSAIDSVNMPLCEYGSKEETLRILNTSFPENLKKSILQEAVQGKLVPQDPSDEPAEALLERIRVEKQRLIKEGKVKKDKRESVIFRRDNSHYEKRGLEVVCIDDEIPFDIPELWSWCRLNELCTKIGAGSTPTGGKTIYVPEGIKFIRSQNVYNDGLKLNDISYITEEINAKKKGSIVRSKDILLNITGGSIGRCAVVPDDFDIANVNQHVMIIRLVEPKMRHWIHTILISEYIQNLIMDVQVGVSREGLSATKLMNFLIPVPPISEQNRILDFCSNISNRLSTL